MEYALSIFITNLAAVMAMMFAVWLLSLIKGDASIVDVFWGLGFVVVTWLTFLQADGYLGRKILITVLTTLWGLRLALHILIRNWGHGEDRRYQAWRAQYDGCDYLGCWFHFRGGERLAIVPLQGSDWQLYRFKAVPENKGKVMKKGLWAYTRHPNYFGESLVWWGLFLITLATPGSGWVVISPLLIGFLLLKVSGVTLLEKTIVDSRPEYAEYIKSTSSFIPWFPRKEKP
jgi:steroid 5-alpha reductase family enzyme